MDERSIFGAPAELPSQVPQAQPAQPPTSGAGLADPRALTILTTEHWSLLSTRSLVYNEAFARGGMFLTFLSATLVALGLVATATGFSHQFLIIAAVVLAFDLFIGLASLGRIDAAGGEDIQALAAMNRLRHAYHELVPGLELYFSTPQHDDLRSVMSPYVIRFPGRGPSIVHGLTTMAGMIGVICAGVLGVLGSVVLLLLTDSGPVAALGGILGGSAGFVALATTFARRVRLFRRDVVARFPAPDGG
jgi:hypothetical protein